MDSPARVVKAEIRGQRSSVFALRATPRQGGQRAEDSWQQAGFRIVDFEMFDDFYDFYGLNDLNESTILRMNELPNQLILDFYN